MENNNDLVTKGFLTEALKENNKNLVTKDDFKLELDRRFEEQTRDLLSVLETMTGQLQGIKEAMQDGKEAMEAIKSDINPRLETLEEKVGLS